MIIATAIVLIIILILICILVVPLNVLLKLKIEGSKISGYIKITWMRIRLIKREFPEYEVKEKKEKRAVKEQKFDTKKLPKIISLLYESLPHLMGVFKAFLKSTNFQGFNLKLRLGLGNPYDTVLISGYLYSIIAIMNSIPRVSLYLEPDFHNGRLEAAIKLKIKIILFWIVFKSLRALTKKPVRALINEFRRMR